MFKIFKKFSDDSYEFKPLLIEIEDKPVNPLGKSILWIVVAIIVFGTLWLFLAKVDVVVSARGKVIPSGEIKILKPLENGIVSKIFIKEGDRVDKNTTLMQIDPTVSEVSLSVKELELQTLNMSIERLLALSYDENLTTPLNKYEQSLYLNQKNSYLNSILQYNLKVDQLISNLKAINSEILNLELLFKSLKDRVSRLEKVKDIIAYKEYESAKNELNDIKNKLAVANENKSQTTKKIDELKREILVFKESTKSKYLDELVTKQKQAGDLKAQINALKFQGKNQLIKSPVKGYVGKLMVNTEGGVVTTSETLLSIIPSNTPLIIKATVLNKDIGFLKLDQDVAIKVDTFNFQKYGKLNGKIIHIANDAIKDENLGEIYEVKISLDKTNLMVEGELKDIEPGMSVTAEIKTGKRRVIELFIYPLIKYLDEGLSVR
ncbi:HlyD family type I secretion periplasmic adaptor subunit [Campylobacter corcagiensis]|uniref:HlyD family type I secretion periplasmic adaptor subunit n=1 Tax=Campylobacter corcagiensis TaxID=1448857 RepID=A0A7M1LDW6_9BACT|nr:HlyD family type I secretion periplasmic adaptor subunit [Campylobacter corcagiensis]QKF65212.1 type I secretion system membrane fusion protein, HlyD family [Campylobacter corcagiensis]QOQ86650.1 HlyD family type I secretion periplasmic adaptor subunit [Campylobacter corcagiensis]